MSMYSVEQVELMRRLRLTGITAQQIIDAFDTLDRLERDLAPYQMQAAMASLCNGAQTNPLLNPAPTTPILSASLGSHQITAIKTFASPYDSMLNRFRSNGNGTPTSQTHSSGSSAIHVSRRKRSMINPQFPLLQRMEPDESDPLGEIGRNDLGPPRLSDENIWDADGIKPPFGETNNSTPLGGSFEEPKTTPGIEILETNTSFPLTQERHFQQMRIRRRRGDGRMCGLVRPIITTPVSIDYSQYVDERELEEFMKCGEVEALRIIKEFVAARLFRQQTIATMTGISQPYVSRFLNGTGRELSARVRRIMYRWYLAVKKYPDLPAKAEFMISEETGPPTMVPINSNSMFSSTPPESMSHDQFSSPVYPQGGSMFGNVFQSPSNGNKDLAKRERFIFKPVHIRLLHKYFALDPYPSIRKREEIAAACNRAYETLDGGKHVTHREVVNHQVIANWFSNRRKEQKRKGELKMRRMRGGRLGMMGTIRRIEHRPLSSTGTYHQHTPHTSASNVSNISTVPNSFDDHRTTQNGDCGKQECNDLANVVNELQAASNSLLALSNPYGNEGMNGDDFKAVY